MYLNGIMLVSHIRYLQQNEGVTNFREAVRRGSMERLAPVLMTALTAGLGLDPYQSSSGFGVFADVPFNIRTHVAREGEIERIRWFLFLSDRSWLEEIVPDAYGCALALIHACHF